MDVVSACLHFDMNVDKLLNADFNSFAYAIIEIRSHIRQDLNISG